MCCHTQSVKSFRTGPGAKDELTLQWVEGPLRLHTTEQESSSGPSLFDVIHGIIISEFNFFFTPSV